MIFSRGAKQHNLPQDYISKLEMLPDNGYDNDIDAMLGQIAKDSY